METKIDIITKLNLTQFDMAMLLKITRTQWSLYELGLRTLPIAAMKRFAELIMFLQIPINQKAKKLPLLELQENKMRKMYEHSLIETLFKKEEGARKIAKMEKKYAAALEVLQLLSEVSYTSNELETLNSSALHLLKYNATKTLEKNGLHHLAKLQLNHQMFLHQELLLNILLKKE